MSWCHDAPFWALEQWSNIFNNGTTAWGRLLRSQSAVTTQAMPWRSQPSQPLTSDVSAPGDLLSPSKISCRCSFALIEPRTGKDAIAPRGVRKGFYYGLEVVASVCDGGAINSRRTPEAFSVWQGHATKHKRSAHALAQQRSYKCLTEHPTRAPAAQN